MTDELELMLLLAGTRARRSASRPRLLQLAHSVDERKLGALLARHRMLPLGVGRLEAHAPGAFSVETRNSIDRHRTELRTRATLFDASAGFVTGLLEGGGIPVLSLKGPGLAHRLYGDPALRTFADLDVLVDAGQLVDAARLCGGLGYVAEDGPDDRLPRLHRVLVHPAQALPPLELHWRVHWYETRFAADMLERSSRPEDGERTARRDDELASLLLFYARDGFAGLKLAADIAAWWDRYGEELKPGALGALAMDYPALASAWRSAAMSAERVVGVPARTILGNRPPRRRRTDLAVRLARWDLDGDDDQIVADVTLVDGLCSPTNQLPNFLRRHVFCDAERIRDYYSLPPDAGARLRGWQAVHPFKMAARYALSFWTLRAGRRASPPPLTT